MAARRKKLATISSELGEGDFGITYNNKTGRPIRNGARKTESPFVDSAVAISDANPELDESDDHEVTSDDEGIVVRTRKRKRSPSPPISEASLSDEEGALRSDDDSGIAMGSPPVGTTPSAMPLQLTLNVPAGPERQVVINLDLGSMLLKQSLGAQPLSSSPMPQSKRARSEAKNHKSRTNRERTARNPKPALNHASPQPKSLKSQTTAQLGQSTTDGSSPSSRAGFLDLPAELRNEVYRLAFVSPSRFDFGAPTAKAFQRSSAFLRTCKQIHNEGRTILYAENEFFFQRQSRRHGSIWAADWGELGFKPSRKFLKMIGPTNTSFIRHITFLLEDAAPSLNPNLHNAEERRFVHDENLHSVLRHVSTHGKLEKFHINFQGRKTLDVYYPNDHFLDLLTRIRADEVEFVKHPVWGSHSSYHSRSKQTNSVQKMCMETMVRKRKLFALA